MEVAPNSPARTPESSRSEVNTFSEFLEQITQRYDPAVRQTAIETAVQEAERGDVKEAVANALKTPRDDLDKLGEFWVDNLFTLYKSMQTTAKHEWHLRNLIGTSVLEPTSYAHYQTLIDVPEGMTVSDELAKSMFEAMRGAAIEAVGDEVVETFNLTTFEKGYTRIADTFNENIVMLNVRDQIVGHVIDIKERFGIPTIQRVRKNEMIERLLTKAKKRRGSDEDFVAAVKRIAVLVHDASVAYQDGNRQQRSESA